MLQFLFLLIQFGFPVPPDPPSPDGSLECQSIEVQMSDVDWEIQQFRAAMERTRARRVTVDNQLALVVQIQMQYIRDVQPIPPGVTNSILILIAWSKELEQKAADQQRQMQALSMRWGQLWVQYDLAGC